MIITGDKFEDVLKTAQKMYDTALKKADEQNPVVQGVEKCACSIEFSSRSLKVKDGWGSTRNPVTISELDGQLQKFLSSCDEEETRLKSIHEKNLPRIENNQKVRERVGLLMRHMGIPDTYRIRDYKSRSKTLKWITNAAGYIGDLDRNVPVSDNFDQAIRILKEARSAATSFVDNKRKELEQSERLAKKEAEEKRAEAVLIHCRVKYNCDPQDPARDVLDTILNKNKYLHLAHYMMMNRGDWSEGCSYAETGLAGFIVETDEDERIRENVQELIDNWGDCPDGRVFRDCHYNYDHIFGLVGDGDLMKDYNEIYKMVAY